ncbi:tetratricopeptide repeat protein [Streptomyces sp. NBC_00536]|uniref:tetratricopeptide repeat protein n=1 Tax=Streptomyces sp. NBC_00536 TaxID=2975769 RepID=UPI002E811DE0|nr:tetratricopeptide repeat protein [Streptomyces sp. NBC_00536]WUC82665.1 tetratricopeptide repeat protein [Streptomyces sp. NBC_00536]
MNERAVSRQELIQRRRRGGFVGRRRELAVFEENFARLTDDAAYQFLFHVHGTAGVGKTSLLRQWEAAARRHRAVTAFLGDEVHGVLEAMEAVSAQLLRQGFPLKGFDKLLATYHLRRHEAETAAPEPGQEPGPGAAGPSVTSELVARAGVAGLGLVPGLGPVAGALDPQQVAAGAERLRVALGARLRSREDVQLVLSPLRVLTPAFLTDLAAVAGKAPWVVLFLDTYERTAPVLDEWLRDVLIAERYGPVPVSVQVVLCGQGRLDPRWWGDCLELIAPVGLDVFSEEEARALLAARGVTHDAVVDLVLRLSGRLPVLVDLLAQARPGHPDAVEDPSDTAVERFLKWEADPLRRAAALDCALPLYLDQDVFAVAVDGGALPPERLAAEYGRLRGLSFVTDQAGRCRYHDVVRAAMLRVRRAQSPARWRTDQLRLADAMRRWREAREGGPPGAREPWQDPVWREHRLGEMYHLLCADPVAALPGALDTLVRACDPGGTAAHRGAGTAERAGQDAGDPALAALGRELREAADTGGGGTVRVLTLLLGAPGLAGPSRALAHTLRGREHRNSGQDAWALADYGRAIALDPGAPRAYFGRGATHVLAGRYEEALADLDHFLEREPGAAHGRLERGKCLHYLGRYEEALADFDRALLLNPEDPWTLCFRAQAQRSLGRAEQAMADFDAAVARDPDDGWIRAWRGSALHGLRRYEEALADLDRSLEQRPEYVWALAQRAGTLGFLGRFEEALADLDAALRVRPGAPWILVRRGHLHRRMRRYAGALADFDAALAAEPANGWARAGRGETLRCLGRPGEALAELDRAHALDPADPWILAWRGRLHRRSGRPARALDDFNRALALAPDSAWDTYEHALVLRLTGRDAEPGLRRAAGMFAREAARTGVDGVRSRGNLIVVLCALGDWERAAAETAVFLAPGRPGWQIEEVLDDLADLRGVRDPEPRRSAELAARLSAALG